MRKDSENIRNMFDGIARRYDFLNHLLSLGIDRGWRRRTVSALKRTQPSKVLDLATGTGDLAIAIARKIEGCRVTGGDLSREMLKVGRAKVWRSGLGSRIELIQCNAMELPFSTECYDAVTVAFGVRNFENLERGLSEMQRVMRGGGKIFILEFSKPRNSIISAPYLFYIKRVLPIVGRMVSKDRYAYNYLPESVIDFPEGETFQKIMLDVGFINCKRRTLSFGIATLYMGEKKVIEY